MDLLATKETSLQIIREAGEITKKYFRQIDLPSHSKGGVDFVTKADLEVDAFLRKELHAAFPDTRFLTEETAPKDFRDLKDTENLWVIDPIDGTTNFSRGDDHFAISVALVTKGRPMLGIVYLPEENKTYTAIYTEDKAYCNGEPISVSPTREIGQASVGFDFSWNIQARRKMLRWAEKFAPVIRQPLSLGSAASDLCKLAAGETDGYMIVGIYPWDVAAAGLIVEKAGGKITTPIGEEWDIFASELVASNGFLHDTLLQFVTS